MPCFYLHAIAPASVQAKAGITSRANNSIDAMVSRCGIRPSLNWHMIRIGARVLEFSQLFDAGPRAARDYHPGALEFLEPRLSQQVAYDTVARGHVGGCACLRHRIVSAAHLGEEPLVVSAEALIRFAIGGGAMDIDQHRELAAPACFCARAAKGGG